jgi:hypothetical protein
MSAHATELLQGPVVSYGITLAGRYEPAQLEGILERIPGDKLIGEVRIALTLSNTPNIVNVECWPDGLGVNSAIVGCEIAAKRLRTVYQIGPERLNFQPVDIFDSGRIRERAESIVDFIRDAALHRDQSSTARFFRHARENAVRMVMAELAAASRLVEKF